jgi:hypothetical protein
MAGWSRSSPPWSRSESPEASPKHRYGWDGLAPHLGKYAGLAGDLLGLLGFGSAVAENLSTTKGGRECERIGRGIRQSSFEVSKAALRHGVRADQ